MIGPPTSQALGVRGLEDVRRAPSRSRSPTSAACKVTILRLFNAYGPRNHLSWWGGPMVTFIEALLDGEPMEIHGDGRRRGRSPTSRTPSTASCARWRRRSRAARSINVGGDRDASRSSSSRSAIQDRARDPAQPLRAHVRRRTRRCPATTRTSATGSPTRRRRGGCSASRRKIALDEGLSERSSGTRRCAAPTRPPRRTAAPGEPTS